MCFFYFYNKIKNNYIVLKKIGSIKFLLSIDKQYLFRCNTKISCKIHLHMVLVF